MPLPPPPSSPPPPYPHSREPLSLNWPFLRSLLGVLRISQLVAGAVCWITLAAHKYEGATYFAVFAAVLVWLLTLAIFGLSLLGRWALVPGLGKRWLITNIVHDLLFGVILFSAASGIMVHKAQDASYCNLSAYQFPCNYSAYLSAAVFAGISAIFYLLSGLYCLVRRSRGHHDII
ncbi:MARVEL domain-containing protein 1 [Sphaerodactylus townsendi]|uniref:MARVEL domain-containing protein 1 n=1 Tax=Sphaerodactylus townsendi TaxID=933632 RepID=UPI0020269745|nr:MARVEL domain-containing protein 1 [Sphaerodactylus townsendi]